MLRKCKGKYGFWYKNKWITEEFDLIKFIIECFENCDEDEWISFLRRSNLDDFEEPYESSLWSAGRTISQSYYINMYALKVLGEKLNEDNK